MRLINTNTLKLEEYEGANVPPFGVLSHRWGSVQDEVSYSEFSRGDKENSPGHRKIREFCARARADGLSFAWIDTCCIDKRSSAELSEAINSMFTWYRRSVRCYAYLTDVSSGVTWQESSWWSRGWTLQELIAPRDVVFFDRDWRQIGTKSALATEIMVLTGIPDVVLSMPNQYRHWSVAQKMSWAAGRKTTRVEDGAYCLLGIFNINMSLLYGEGDKAFARLQLEVLQKFMDESIFAWPSDLRARHRVLARSADDFRTCGYMSPSSARKRHENPVSRIAPHRVSSWGIEITANAYKLKRTVPARTSRGTHEYLWAVPLVAAWNRELRELPCTIVLKQIGPASYTYERMACYEGDSKHTMQRIGEWCRILELVKDKVFYLLYDRHFND